MPKIKALNQNSNLKINKLRLIRIIRLILIIFFFFNFGKLNPIKAVVGEPCCPVVSGSYQYSYNEMTGACCMSGPQGRVCRSDNIQCDPNTEVCQQNVCFSIDDLPPPPSGTTCGYNNQPCCHPSPYTTMLSCVAGFQPVTEDGECICVISSEEPPPEPITLLKPTKCCTRNIPNPWAVDCPEESEGIQTALGCFPINPTAIIQWILKYAIMAAGGVGFIIMLFASFMIMTSSGDPEKLKNGQQLLGAAISGILLIVFSLFILRFIGATILKIPGWG